MERRSRSNGSKPENKTIVVVTDGEFNGTWIESEGLELRVEISVRNTKTAHDVVIAIDLPSGERIEIVKGDIHITKATSLVGTPELRLSLE